LGGAVSATGAVMMTMAPAPPTIIKLNGALSYSPILYLDATNSSSYNVSTNTWTNLGSLGGNVVMTNMVGTFDAADNGGSFNFNGSSNYGTLNVASTTLTSITYVAVVKTTVANTNSGSATIIEFGANNLLFRTSSNTLNVYLYTSSGFLLSAGIWYAVAVTITSDGTFTYYVNGVSVFRGTGGNNPASTMTIFSIGGGVGGNEYLNGKISSIAAYNRVLTASEIYNLYISSDLYISSALLRSTDFGNTFTEIPGTTLTSPAYWRAIAITNSGAIQTALAHGSSIFRSADYGSTWNSTAPPMRGNPSRCPPTRNTKQVS
jgi:hypothetical protein